MKTGPSYESLRAALRKAALSGAGALTPQERETIFTGGTPPGAVGSYVATLRAYAHRVTDDDLARLSDAGCSDDVIYEATVMAALGVGFSQFERARQAMEAAGATA